MQHLLLYFIQYCDQWVCFCVFFLCHIIIYNCVYNRVEGQQYQFTYPILNIIYICHALEENVSYVISILLVAVFWLHYITDVCSKTCLQNTFTHFRFQIKLKISFQYFKSSTVRCKIHTDYVIAV